MSRGPHPELWPEHQRLDANRFFALSHEMQCIAGFDGYFRWLNPAWQRVLGFSHAELMARPFIEFVHPDDVEATTIEAGRLSRAADVVFFENRYRCRDGTYKWLVWNASPDVERQVSYAVAHDVTERKQAEAALLASNALNASLVDTLPLQVFRKDLDSRFTFVNDRFCAWLDRPRADVIGRTDHDFFPREQADALRADELRLIESGEPLDAVEKHLKRGGGVQYIRVIKTPVFGADGAIVGTQGVFWDVTHDQEVSLMKSEFISLVSHELRTPLTSIKGYVDLLLDGEVGELTVDQREFLYVVRNNSDRLVTLVNDLLDISGIEAGKIQLERRAVEVGPVVQEVAASLRPLFVAKGQTLHLDLADPLPAVFADPNRLRQIVANLLSNAHKYTPLGGRIDVRARAAAGGVRVDVRDSGIGLSAEEQDKLFTKFFRAKNRATEEVGGTGLGLAITRSLVELHGGRISVTSAPGQGSTFSFTLPQPAEQPAVEGGAPVARPGKRNLVVDDEPDVRHLLPRMNGEAP